ncbi:MAG: hypothetical protein IJ555_07460 [Ruminococcus sp.]|nr:hypothetical protein [Ruminococcus sp.]
MAEQNTGIFRKSSMDRISSPEQLTDYLKVTNPGIWVLLAAVIILLGGLFAWSMVGNLETVAEGVAVVENGTAQIMVTDTANSEIASGMTVRIGDDEYSIASVGKDEYGRAVAFAPIDKTDGRYDVKIVTESVHPIKFLFD